MDTSEIAFYAVQNSDGKFFRRKGYGGSGDTWVEGLKTARVWTKIGGARATVTFFANHYPQYPTPKIIKMSIGSTEVIDETARVTAARDKKRKQEEEREVREAQYKLKQAEEDLQKAQERYDREKRKRGGN